MMEAELIHVHSVLGLLMNVEFMHAIVELLLVRPLLPVVPLVGMLLATDAV